MKDLLYLKDEQLKEFIEKLFISYRESFGDAKKTLEKHSLGIAHHKVIHIISIHHGITITNLLKRLKVTKQSLNRILNDLVKFNIISFIKDEQLKEFIEKLFIGYRESFGDAKKTLDKHSLGIAHHKVIHIIFLSCEQNQIYYCRLYFLAFQCL